MFEFFKSAFNRAQKSLCASRKVAAPVVVTGAVMLAGLLAGCGAHTVDMKTTPETNKKIDLSFKLHEVTPDGVKPVVLEGKRRLVSETVVETTTTHSETMPDQVIPPSTKIITERVETDCGPKEKDTGKRVHTAEKIIPGGTKTITDTKSVSTKEYKYGSSGEVYTGYGRYDDDPKKPQTYGAATNFRGEDAVEEIQMNVVSGASAYDQDTARTAAILSPAAELAGDAAIGWGLSRSGGTTENNMNSGGTTVTQSTDVKQGQHQGQGQEQGQKQGQGQGQGQNMNNAGQKPHRPGNGHGQPSCDVPGLGGSRR